MAEKEFAMIATPELYSSSVPNNPFSQLGLNDKKPPTNPLYYVASQTPRMNWRKARTLALVRGNGCQEQSD
jgi:hypothetical protein